MLIRSWEIFTNFVAEFHLHEIESLTSLHNFTHLNYCHTFFSILREVMNFFLALYFSLRSNIPCGGSVNVLSTMAKSLSAPYGIHVESILWVFALLAQSNNEKCLKHNFSSFLCSPCLLISEKVSSCYNMHTRRSEENNIKKTNFPFCLTFGFFSPFVYLH